MTLTEPERNRRIMLALPLAAPATEEAAKGLEGQWLTILIGGQHALCYILEAAPTPDGKRLDLVAETEWAGLTLQEIAGE